MQNGNILDENVTLFGFRTAVFLKDGFYLNGKKVKLRGLNRHQSYPYVGYAMPESMQKRDADILKNELGVNAVRTSHYPQSRHFVERCDELGLLVFTEIPGWQHLGDVIAVVPEGEFPVNDRLRDEFVLRSQQEIFEENQMFQVFHIVPSFKIIPIAAM